VFCTYAPTPFTVATALRSVDLHRALRVAHTVARTRYRCYCPVAIVYCGSFYARYALRCRTYAARVALPLRCVCYRAFALQIVCVAAILPHTLPHVTLLRLRCRCVTGLIRSDLPFTLRYGYVRLPRTRLPFACCCRFSFGYTQRWILCDRLPPLRIALEHVPHRALRSRLPGSFSACGRGCTRFYLLRRWLRIACLDVARCCTV